MLGERRLVEAVEDQDLGAREEGGVQLEGRVLGGGPDQHDGAVLHVRQEAILLRLVEAVDLVDEEQRAAAVGVAQRAASKIFFSSATPVKMALIWTKLRSVSAAIRRAIVVLPEPGGPQRTRDGQPPGGEHPAERARPARADGLAHDLGEARRAEPVGKGRDHRDRDPCRAGRSGPSGVGQ
jgi:hypothetical protein